MLKRMGLTHKIALVFSGSMVVLLGIMAFSMVQLVGRTVIPLTEELSGTMVTARSAEIGRWLEGHRKYVRAVSGGAVFRSGNPEEIQGELSFAALDLPEEYESLFFADLRGRYYATDGSSGSVVDRDYFRSIIDIGARQVISDSVVSLGTGSSVIVIASAARTAEGDTVGILGATVRLETLSRIADSVAVGRGSYGWIADGAGRFIAHPEPAVRTGNTVSNLDDEGFEGYTDLGDRIKLRESGIMTTMNPQGEQEIILFHPVPDSPGWTLALAVPRAVFLETSDTALRAVVAFSSIILAVVVGVSVVFAHFLARPIKATADVLEDIAEGGGDLTRELPVRSEDELGKLARNFNKFVDTLGQMILTIRVSSKDLMTNGDELGTLIQATTESLNGILTEIEEVRSVVHEQSSSVTETSSTIEQISRNIEALNRLIEDQAAGVNQSSSSVEEMVANIRSVSSNLESSGRQFEKLIQASETGREKITEVNNLIRQIAEKSDSLEETNTLIQEISNQTNLLAMNAAIEAAHAGEFGKGFAVVSDEIRRLAEGAGEQSKSISSVLNSIKEEIDTVVVSSSEAEQSFDVIMEMINTVHDLEEEIRRAMEEQSAGSNEVLKALTQINNITTEVQGGSGEMTAGSKVILEEMNRLITVTETVQHGMDRMNEAAASIHATIRKITETGNKNQVSIDTVIQRVTRFKVKGGRDAAFSGQNQEYT
jgi:methyl-accepting chemotaxis protein